MSERELKVYIVDDEASIVDWLVNNIEWDVYNCRVIGCSLDSSEAYEFLKNQPVDILLTDICMPNMYGLDLIRSVKNLYSDIFIIVISAYDKFEYVKKSFQYGVINYCIKPIDVDELYTSLKLIATEIQERFMHNWKQDIVVFRNSIFQRLLNGEINEIQLIEQCELADIQLCASRYQVVVIRIIQLENYQYHKILNRVDEIIPKGVYCFLDGYMNIVLLFLNNTGFDEQIQEKLYRILEQESIEKSFFVFIGEAHTSYRLLAESYRGCLDYSKVYFLFSEKMIHTGIYKYEQFCNEYRNRILNMGIGYLKQGSYYQLLEIATEIMKKSEQEENIQMVNLVALLMKGIRTEFPELHVQMPEQLQEYSVTEIYGWLRKFLMNFLEQKEIQQKQMNPFVSFALKEINKNYSNPLLSLQELAKQCDVSSAYLGKLFKEQVDEYFNDYLLKFRLKEAERLLSESAYRIHEIASKVGFNYTSYFNRSFFQKYGISPSEYRRIHKGE